jgi:hypothetical protein
MQNTPLTLALALTASIGLAAPALADTAQPTTPAHHTRHHVHHTARHQTALAPLTPVKPAPAPVTAQNTAPMPNESVTAPIDNHDQDTSVAPAVMQIHYPPMGDGYTTGSSAQAMDDREAAKVTGVQVKVPLGQ